METTFPSYEILFLFSYTNNLTLDEMIKVDFLKDVRDWKSFYES